MEWTSGRQPWIRRPEGLRGTRDGADAAHGAVCYFCGQTTVTRASEDIDGDTGRLRLCCDNPGCDVGAVTVLVEHDGHQAARRADVRALQQVEHLHAGAGAGGGPHRAPDVRERVQARWQPDSFVLEVP